MANFMKTVIVVLLATLLFGCSRYGSNFFIQKNQERSNFEMLSRDLSRKYVSIHKDANSTSTSLLLPSKYFFERRSANFTKNAYDALESILIFSRYFKDASAVLVTGIHAGHRGTRLNKDLAVERARRVAEYLWSYGMDVTFVCSGGKNLASKERVSKGDWVLIEFVYST